MDAKPWLGKPGWQFFGTASLERIGECFSFAVFRFSWYTVVCFHCFSWHFFPALLLSASLLLSILFLFFASLVSCFFAFPFCLLRCCRFFPCPLLRLFASLLFCFASLLSCFSTTTTTCRTEGRKESRKQGRKSGKCWFFKDTRDNLSSRCFEALVVWYPFCFEFCGFWAHGAWI